MRPSSAGLPPSLPTSRCGWVCRRTAWPKPAASTTAFPPSDINDLLPEADVLYAFRLPEGIRERARRLKWLQFATAGADQAIAARSLRHGACSSPPAAASMRYRWASTSWPPCSCSPTASLRQPISRRPTSGSRTTAPSCPARPWASSGTATSGGRSPRLALALGMKVVATRRSVDRGHGGGAAGRTG